MTGDSELAREQRQFSRARAVRDRRINELRQAPTDIGADAWTNAVLASNRAKKIASLGDPNESVAFGRIDTDNPDQDYFYIGNRHIDCSDFQVLNWRAPAAKPFYSAHAGNPMSLTRRRKFECSRNAIKSFQDEIFADLKQRVDALSGPAPFGPPDDALLRSLEASRGDNMKQIAQTIQAAQYDVMTAPIDRHLIVQGGAGTGKTAIALHRVSWMLYEHADWLRPEDVLVIGPSERFNEFVHQVLPSLGDAGVQHGDLRHMGPAASDHIPEDSDVAALKGDVRMAQVLKTALFDRVGATDSRVVLGSGATTTVFLREELDEQITKCVRGQSYNKGRSQLAQWFSRELSVRTRGRAEVPESAILSAVQRIWPQVTPGHCLAELYSARQMLERSSAGVLSEDERTLLLTKALRADRTQQWSDADVALLDELWFLIEGRQRSYKHVVVDEAQDLTAMQVRSISRRATQGHCTLVGDVAQSTEVSSRTDWSDIVHSLGGDSAVTLRTLDVGYRVPSQVFDLALRVMPLAAPGITPPRAIRRAAVEPAITAVSARLLSARVAEEATALATTGLKTGVILHQDLKSEVQRLLAGPPESGGGRGSHVDVLTPKEAKGLEFDAVVLVEPARMTDGGPVGARELYIALTRTTNRLSLIHSRGCSLLGLPSAALPAERSGREEGKTQPAIPRSNVERIVATPSRDIGSGLSTTAPHPPAPPKGPAMVTPTSMAEDDLVALLELVAGELATAPRKQQRRFVGALQLVLGLTTPSEVQDANTSTVPARRQSTARKQTGIAIVQVFAAYGEEEFHASLDCPDLQGARVQKSVAWCLAREAHQSRLTACANCAVEMAKMLTARYGVVPSGVKKGRGLPKLTKLGSGSAQQVRTERERDREKESPTVPYGQPTGVDDLRFGNRSAAGWRTASYGQHPDENLGSPTDDDNDWRGSSRYS